MSDFTFPSHFPALEKEMATHSSVLAWRIPGMGEPGGLPSMGSHRVGHDWSDLAAIILHWEHTFNKLLPICLLRELLSFKVCGFLSSPMKVKVKLLSHVRLFATPWTVAHQAPLSMGFSRQHTGVGYHFLLQGIFPTQGSNPGLPHCRQRLYPLSHQGGPRYGSFFAAFLTLGYFTSYLVFMLKFSIHWGRALRCNVLVEVPSLVDYRHRHNQLLYYNCYYRGINK